MSSTLQGMWIITVDDNCSSHHGSGVLVWSTFCSAEDLCRMSCERWIALAAAMKHSSAAQILIHRRCLGRS
jgi:hypothetical protein